MAINTQSSADSRLLPAVSMEKNGLVCVIIARSDELDFRWFGISADDALDVFRRTVRHSILAKSACGFQSRREVGRNHQTGIEW